ncbi:MAG: MXAN_6640 family putative metalloprotease, partial [bacterium]
MKARLALLLIAILSLTFSFSLSAATLTAEEQARVDYLRSALEALRDGTEVPTDSLSGPGSYKCGTPLVLEAWHYHQKYGSALGLDDMFARPSDETFPETFDSPGGHFKIHYTTDPTNIHVVNTDYGDQNRNGVTDYVEMVARIADSVWQKQIVAMGFHAPVDDGEFEWGGDSRYDIYLEHLDPKYYGLTYPDGVAVGNGQQATSYLVLRNHYEVLPEYSDRPLEALEVTAAHEFFHAIQFWYDAYEDNDDTVEHQPNPFWLEMSAVWMEEQCYDKVNDYYYYLPGYTPYVHRSLRFFEASSAYPYGAAIFPIYLSETFGQGIVKTIWENCATIKGMNFLYGALQDAIDQYSNGTRAFEDVFAEYSRWLFFTGGRKPYFFEEAANYPKIPDTDTIGTEVSRPYIRYYSDFPTAVDRDYGFF